MNDTGGGVTAIHDVPGDITRIGFHWMLLFPFCHSKGSSICSSHGVSRRSRGSSCHEFANLRIFSSHGMSRRSRGFSLSRICEFANFFFTRNVAEVTDFFVTRLVLGPTDQREVICELSNCFFTRSVAE